MPTGHFVDGRLVAGAGNTLIVRRPTDNVIGAELPIANGTWRTLETVHRIWVVV